MNSNTEKFVDELIVYLVSTLRSNISYIDRRAEFISNVTFEITSTQTDKEKMIRDKIIAHLFDEQYHNLIHLLQEGDYKIYLNKSNDRKKVWNPVASVDGDDFELLDLTKIDNDKRNVISERYFKLEKE